MKKTTVRKLGIAAGALTLAGAITALFLKNRRTIPEGIQAVSPFNADLYLGEWYEIARFDFRFERGLDHTTANYTRNADGSIKVVNTGRKKDGTITKATGKAIFVGPETTAQLKVSFFGPFYAGYNVIALDEDYRYALVCGNSRDYLWILSRKTNIPETVKQQYLQQAQALGFKTEKLIWPDQS
jgi:apolipoprotein D and lipocalin family protein